MLGKQEWSTYRKLLFTQTAGGGSLNEYTATGNPLTFNTNKAKPLRSVLATWQPHQSGSGDPSPSNVRSISGMDGVNVWHTGINVFDGVLEDGQLDETGQDKTGLGVRSKNYISVVPGEKYRPSFVAVGSSGSNMRMFFYDKNKTYVSNRWASINTTFTIGSNVYYARFYMDGAYTQASSRDISLNYSSTDNTFHPYSGTSYSVAFPVSVGTVYGGSLDLTTGVLTATHRTQVFNGSETLSKYGTYTDGIRVNSSLLDDAVQGDKDALSDKATREASVPSTITRLGFRIGSGLSKLAIFVPDSMFDGEATVDKFKAWLAENNLKVCITLAEPQTFQLTPQQITALLGNNTMWADADELSVTYLKKG